MLILTFYGLSATRSGFRFYGSSSKMLIVLQNLLQTLHFHRIYVTNWWYIRKYNDGKLLIIIIVWKRIWPFNNKARISTDGVLLGEQEQWGWPLSSCRASTPILSAAPTPACCCSAWAAASCAAANLQPKNIHTHLFAFQKFVYKKFVKFWKKFNKEQLFLGWKSSF